MIDNNETLDLNEILRIRRMKLKELQESNKDPFMRTKYEITATSALIKDNFEEMEGKSVSLAGRLMSKRDMGKASFMDIQDMYGRIQLFIRINDIGEET